MTRARCNLVQLVLTVLTLVAVLILPAVKFNVLGLVTFYKVSILKLAIDFQPLMWGFLLVLLVEIIVSLRSTSLNGLVLGGIGLLFGVIVGINMGAIVCEGNISRVFNAIQTILPLVPESVRSQLPAEMTPENIETVRQFLLTCMKTDIGYWVYVGSQVLYIVTGVLLTGSKATTAKATTKASSQRRSY